MKERRRLCIRIAGNTENPALLALRAKGYRVWLEYTKVDDPKSPWQPYMPDYQAEKEGTYFSATTPVELLGLAAMWETRGDDWKPLMFLPDLLGADATARQPRRQVRPQAEDRVIPAGGFDRLNSQIRPLRKLPRHEAADERSVDPHFGGRPGAWH